VTAGKIQQLTSTGKKNICPKQSIYLPILPKDFPVPEVIPPSSEDKQAPHLLKYLLAKICLGTYFNMFMLPTQLQDQQEIPI